MTDFLIPPLASSLAAPVWHTLAQADPALVRGGALARRFHPDVGPFAAVADRSAESFSALAALVDPGEQVMLHTPDALPAPEGFTTDMQAGVLQMVWAGGPVAPPEARPESPAVQELGAADAPEMVDLAARTRPGPFGLRTHELGHYIGLRNDAGALVAMAGERMRFDGFVEVSGVCVDPSCQGRGYATRLMALLMQRIQQQGGVPFLHVLAGNNRAIGLYRAMGFADSGAYVVTLLRR